MTPIDPASVASALASVRVRIVRACASAGREPGLVAILAVTKGFDRQAPEAAMAAGLTDIGENYYQEAADKFSAVAWLPGIRRHFIGRVQRNKARRIAALFDVVQTVDGLHEAQALDEGAAEQRKTLDVLVQVNASDDARQGVALRDIGEFVRALGACHNLRVRGLMAVGPRETNATAAAFARAAACFEELRASSPSIDMLSMGMSDDLELAVAAGSTMLRLGSALFGSRPPKAPSTR
jgi:PLP dependent protein